MPKILTVGAALIDIYLNSNDFLTIQHEGQDYLAQPIGSKMSLSERIVVSGGGATNCAVNFARLGNETSIVAEIGGDIFADQIITELKKDKIDLSLLIKESDETTGLSIILLNKIGERVALIDRSASGMLDSFDLPVQQINDFDWLHCTSLNGNLAAMNKVLELVRFKKMGFSWNPGTAELRDLAEHRLQLPDFFASNLFIVNKEEWAMIANKQSEVLDKFNFVVITDGANGGSVYNSNQKVLTYRADVVADKRIDDTGAGDAFGSTLVSFLLEGMNLEKSVTIAKKVAAHVTHFYGAKDGLIPRDELVS
ncbi:carbohydrate kinase family protein [Microgenomates group bacterium]|nr:carbohydrate kinase family protein [Microgenomates group bacterium]